MEGGKFKDNGELAKVFASAGVDIKAPIVASCGTGVTASVLALALHQVSPASKVWLDFPFRTSQAVHKVLNVLSNSGFGRSCVHRMVSVIRGGRNFYTTEGVLVLIRCPFMTDHGLSGAAQKILL